MGDGVKSLAEVKGRQHPLLSPHLPTHQYGNTLNAKTYSVLYQLCTLQRKKKI